MFLLFFTLRYFHYEPPAPIRHRHFSLRPFPSTAVKTAGNARSTVSSLLVRQTFCEHNGEKYIIFAVTIDRFMSRLFPRRCPPCDVPVPPETVAHSDAHFRPPFSPPSRDRPRVRVLPRHSTRPVLQTSVFRIPNRNLGVTPYYLSKKKTALSFSEGSRRHSLKTQAAQGFERYKRIS